MLGINQEREDLRDEPVKDEPTQRQERKAFGMRVTEFADLTQEEFIAKHLTYKSWKKEQMEIAANRAGRQPDDPKVEIPAEAEKSFEKSFGKLEKAVEDESVNAVSHFGIETIFSR